MRCRGIGSVKNWPFTRLARAAHHLLPRQLMIGRWSPGAACGRRGRAGGTAPRAEERMPAQGRALSRQWAAGRARARSLSGSRPGGSGQNEFRPRAMGLSRVQPAQVFIACEATSGSGMCKPGAFAISPRPPGLFVLRAAGRIRTFNPWLDVAPPGTRAPDARPRTDVIGVVSRGVAPDFL